MQNQRKTSQHAKELCIVELAQRKTELRTLHNWWRIARQQVFYPAKGKTEQR